MQRFIIEHQSLLANFEIIATGSTGSMVTAATGIPVRAFRHGPAGGDVQIACEVIAGNVAAVLFFVEPMDVHPHDPDIQTLLRICNIENIPLATNPATADCVVRMLADGV